jgi:hypothetical protein
VDDPAPIVNVRVVVAVRMLNERGVDGLIHSSASWKRKEFAVDEHTKIGVHVIVVRHRRQARHAIDGLSIERRRIAIHRDEHARRSVGSALRRLDCVGCLLQRSRRRRRPKSRRDRRSWCGTRRRRGSRRWRCAGRLCSAWQCRLRCRHVAHARASASAATAVCKQRSYRYASKGASKNNHSHHLPPSLSTR